MAINLYTVKDALEEQGWQLVSTEYKNLKTPLKMICPKGHEQEQTFEKWRKYKRCEECLAGDPYKLNDGVVPPKSIETYRVLGLDAATGTTGYALYDGTQLIKYGTFTTKGHDYIENINQVKHWLLSVMDAWELDFLGAECIQLQGGGIGRDGAPQVELYRKLACLEGVILDTCFEEKQNCGLVYPSEWRKYCGVGGRNRAEMKHNAQLKVKTWYGLDCTEDEADAICIGKYFATNVRRNEKRNNYWGEDLW